METLPLQKTGYQEFNETTIYSVIQTLTQKNNQIYKVEDSLLMPKTNSNKFHNSLSQEFGLNAFPFHTDGAHRIIPPKWLILEYKGLRPSNSATTLLDTLHLQNDRVNENFFFNEIYLVTGGKISFLTTLVNKTQCKSPIFRWNSLIMKKLNSKEHNNLNIFERSISHRFEWIKGKILVIDNWRILHGREAINEDDKTNRIIHRYNLTPIN